MDEATFVEAAFRDPRNHWDPDALGKLALMQVPDAVLGRRRTLLRADASQQWARWFVEGLVDPRRYVGGRLNYAQIFSDVLESVNNRFSDRTRQERQQLASSVSQALRRTVEQLSSERRRAVIDRSQKSFLIDVAGDPARCWICGTAFDQVAVDNFIYGEAELMPVPAFVDVLKPRGLTPRDGAIEIDHILPVALGGENEDNLALACGWCNRSKRAAVSIYEVEGRPRTAGPNRIGLFSLPQPFWIVRQLAVVQHCEHVGGCDRNASNAPMTVSPRLLGGSVNPQNLITTCFEHDPLRAIRLQTRNDVKTLWSKSK